MHVTLIQPAMGHDGPRYVASWKMEPLSLATLAGLTPRMVDLSFWDDRMEPIPYDEPTDLVAISVESYTAQRSYQIAAQYRRRGVPVVLGGYHATLMPDEAERYADAVLVGQAEGVWASLLSDAAAGRLQRRYESKLPPQLASVRPDRSIFAGKRYLPLTLVESGRGCRFGCDFCSISSFYRADFQARPVADIVAEIEAAQRKWIFLVDDNLTVDVERTKELCRALIPLGVKWVSQATVRTAEDPELLDLLVESGCAGLLIGFESIDSDNLKAMNKAFNRGAETYRTAIERIHERGLKIYATFVFGYDAEPPDIYERTLQFALEQKFFVAAFNHLQPFPGTPLYNRLQQEGRLRFERWWLEPGYRFGTVAFQPRHVGPDELYDRLMDLRRRFYGARGILRRSTVTNLFGNGLGWLYGGLNLLLRKELVDKWAIPMGDLGEPFAQPFREADSRES